MDLDLNISFQSLPRKPWCEHQCLKTAMWADSSLKQTDPSGNPNWVCFYFHWAFFFPERRVISASRLLRRSACSQHHVSPKSVACLGQRWIIWFMGAQIEVTAWIAVLTCLRLVLCKCGSSSFWIPVVKQALSSVWSWIYSEFPWWDLINRTLLLADINMKRCIFWPSLWNPYRFQNVTINMSKNIWGREWTCSFLKCINWGSNQLFFMEKK